MIEPLLLAATRILTYKGGTPLTNATGFFFERDDRLFLATSRHVAIDEPSGHLPDRIEIDLHLDADNMAASTGFSIPLYRDGTAVWRQGTDAAGEIDVAAIELDRAALPEGTVYRAFTPAHLPADFDAIEVGSPLLVAGFPLGFHDTLHRTPVVRAAIIASSFGLRFQGQGYFLTDGRTHRGISGAPVVMRAPDAPGGKDAAGGKGEAGRAGAGLDWMLLGIHSARLDVGRDLTADEALGLNSAWYADILMTLPAG